MSRDRVGSPCPCEWHASAPSALEEGTLRDRDVPVAQRRWSGRAALSLVLLASPSGATIAPSVSAPLTGTTVLNETVPHLSANGLVLAYGLATDSTLATDDPVAHATWLSDPCLE